ncbi:fatty acid--CoA ligase family protein [Aliarcobacter cryaerophilus]|uniref:Fatty acid--CoA ligase family protein n=3 Tax=unclassified Arcobacter TaxID=2593671 RepID=A0AA96L6U6_9BACT|nr:fatty acid--CoA ligase family protein [Aliarcobacter cryaerophilus]WNL26815.1 fatty acid--CoA ligase family protein [Arcobacter sp. AZ-2023]WPD06032.1 fatty acid--CoA ligase family protein [Arcobacter sp. DSM 115956]WPD08124.1 fatty acid--CoA ligase family protein [Arcobacter sp. DSM 115955]MCT7501669.1 fatty acid--CoA ligase family protein [Aliarcobacter cryaerophilus]WNL32389.1 fatty acid--CoA ligase family protein [Arcobacter sp. AZ-2023]
MSFILDKLKSFNSKNAIVFEDRIYTYEEFIKQIKDYKNILDKHNISSKVVVILGDYSFYNLALFFALYENKNIIVPITSNIKKVQDDFIEESFCQTIIKTDEKNLLIQNLKTIFSHNMIDNLREKNSSGLILFSSGSTGKPKAMIHNLDTLIDSFKDKKEKSMNMLVFLMFDHIGGLNTVFNALCMGASLIIPKIKDAKTICELIEKYKIMVLPSSPTFLNLILISEEYKNYDLSSLRMITYGTETMPQSLLLKLKEVFPKVKFLQTFGTSETGISTTSSKSSNSLFMKLEDINGEYKIVENELWLRSKTQVLGYLNASMDSFTSDGWFKTGDLVEVDGEYIKIIGRAKEVINVGGQKVLPAEVESVILSIEEISDCMVYGEKNAITGQTVVCDVVLNKNIENIKKRVRVFCKDRLDAYKIPTKVNVVDKTNFSDRFKKIRRKV